MYRCVVGLVALAAVFAGSGCGGRAGIYPDLDSLKKQFDQVYRRKDDLTREFPVETDDVVMGVKGQEAFVYYKRKGTGDYRELTQSSFLTEIDAAHSKKWEILEPVFRKSFTDGLLLIHWEYVLKDNRLGTGLLSKRLGNYMIGIPTADKLK